jgi:hypothetical protein
MNRLSMILTVVILPAWILPAPASGVLGLFGKKTKVNPAERVPALIATLKTEKDERKRASAALELGTFDASAYPEIVPVLVDALHSDPRPSVRMEAVNGLGTLRPVSTMAGQALEKTVTSDDNWRVRWHAKGVLAKYRAAGYTPVRMETPSPAGPKTIEPPLLEPAANLQSSPLPASAPPPVQFPTGPVPLAKAPATSNPQAKAPAPAKDDALEFRPSIARPLPQGPVFTTAVPQQASHTAPPPLPLVGFDGPPLTTTPAPATGVQTPISTPPPPLVPPATAPTAPPQF